MQRYSIDVVFDPASKHPLRHLWDRYHFPSPDYAEGYAQWLTNEFAYPWCTFQSTQTTHHPIIAPTRQREDFHPLYASFGGVRIGDVEEEEEDEIEEMLEIIELDDEPF